MDESNVVKQLSKPEEGIPWEDFFEWVDELQSSKSGSVSPRRSSTVTACVATLPFKKACCYGSCPTEETESLKIVRCKYCELIVKVVGYGHHMRLRHGYRPPPSSASNSGDDCQDFLLSPPHIPMVASTSTVNCSTTVGDYDWDDGGVEELNEVRDDVSRQFGSPANSRICSPPYYVEQCKDLVLVLSKRLPAGQPSKANYSAKSGCKSVQTAGELKKLKKLSSSLPKGKKKKGQKKACTPKLQDAILASALRAYDFEEEEKGNKLEEDSRQVECMSQLSPSASIELEKSSIRPTTRQNSVRNTPSQKVMDRKKKGAAGDKSKGLSSTKAAVKKTTESGLSDGADSISLSSTSSEISSNLPEAQNFCFIAHPKMQAAEATPLQDGTPGSDSESSIIAKLLKLPGVSVRTLSPDNNKNRSPLKTPPASELLSRVKQRLSSDVYDVQYRKRMLDELDAKNLLIRSPENTIRLTSSKLSGQGRRHQICSLPLSPSSESNYSSSSVSNDEITSFGGFDGGRGLELHCLKPSLDTATARIRSFFLKKDNSSREDGVKMELKTETSLDTTPVIVPAMEDAKRDIRNCKTGIVPFFMRRKSSLVSGSPKSHMSGQSSSCGEEMAGGKPLLIDHTKQRLAPIYKTTVPNKAYMGATRFVSVNSNNLLVNSPNAVFPSMVYSPQQQQQEQNSSVAGITVNADYSPAVNCSGIGVSIALSSNNPHPPTNHPSQAASRRTHGITTQRNSMAFRQTRSPISLKTPMIQQEVACPSSTSPSSLDAYPSSSFIDNQAKQTMHKSSAYVNGTRNVNENRSHRRLLPMQPNAAGFQQAGSSQQQNSEYAEQRHQRIMMLRASQATAATAYRNKFGEGDQVRENGMKARQSPSSIGLTATAVQASQSNKKRHHSQNAAATLTSLNMAALPAGQQALVKKFRPIVPKQTQPRSRNSLDPMQNTPDNMQHPMYTCNPQQNTRSQAARKVYTAFERGPPESRPSPATANAVSGKVPNNYSEHHQERPMAHVSSGYFNNAAQHPQQHQQQLYEGFAMNGGHTTGVINPEEMMFATLNNKLTATGAAAVQKINGKMIQQQQQYRQTHTNYRPIAQKGVQQKRAMTVQMQQPQNMRYNNTPSGINNIPFSSSNDFSSSGAQFVINSGSGDKESNHRFSTTDISRVRMQVKNSTSANSKIAPSQLMYIPSPNLQQQNQQQSRSSSASPMILHMNNADTLGHNQFLNIEPPPILEAEGQLSMGSGNEAHR